MKQKLKKYKNCKYCGCPVINIIKTDFHLSCRAMSEYLKNTKLDINKIIIKVAK